MILHTYTIDTIAKFAINAQKRGHSLNKYTITCTGRLGGSTSKRTKSVNLNGNIIEKLENICNNIISELENEDFCKEKLDHDLLTMEINLKAGKEKFTAVRTLHTLKEIADFKRLIKQNTVVFNNIHKLKFKDKVKKHKLTNSSEPYSITIKYTPEIICNIRKDDKKFLSFCGFKSQSEAVAFASFLYSVYLK